MKTKKILIALSILILGLKNQLTAQIDIQCGQQQVMDNWFKSHPEDKLKFEENQKAIALNENQHKTHQSTSSVANYTIPVVFHILHTGGAENISDTQVLDQINILNRDYQKQNADTVNVVPSYTNNIAKVNFAFKLATIDPSGNCTNGIIRHYDSNSYTWPLSVGNFSQYAYTWPSNKYLNIYVVGNIVGLDGAYTILPGTPIPLTADVIVTEHYVTGSIGTANVANSRVLTHEVGHWFNLQHTWGSSNQPGVACGDDLVNDTPITKGFSVCSTANSDVCNPGIFENVQNYMDYSPCKIMFTSGQAARMLTSITNAINGRNNLSSPTNLLATGVTSSTTNCIPIVEVSATTKSICVGSSSTVFSYTSNANVTSYLWTANNGAVVSNSTSANASVLLTSVGNSTVICMAINSNGNDTAMIVLTGINSAVQVSGTYNESFEAIALPNNWTVLNSSTPSSLWTITNVSGSDGTQSLFVNAESANGGSEEILQTPSYDFLNNQGSTFSFKYAYARQSSTHNDVFKVQASKDCGGTWTDIYVPNMLTLANGSGGISSTLFVPTNLQWKYYDITQQSAYFPVFLNESNVIFRFYFKEDVVGFGNRIYLDEINFNSPVGINEFTKSIALNVYPIPTKSSLEVNFTLSKSAKVNYYITNIAGIKLIESNEMLYNEGFNKVLINNLNQFSSGVYFLNVSINGITTVKKIILE